MPERKKVLVIGGGGREHALVAALARSPENPRVYCAPGNAGIELDARCVPTPAATPEDLGRLCAFAKDEAIDLTVVGPEAPLVLGIVDLFEQEGLRILGPPRAGAELEGSKVFCKEFLRRHRIPTADFQVFDSPEAARRHVEERSLPMVLKADGLAQGKGVVVARDRATALDAVDAMLIERRFGAAGERILIEDCLEGSEMSLMVLTDGESYLPLETAQDYKPVYDGNQGPNTGGMGAYSPYHPLGAPVVQRAIQTVIRPAIEGLRRDGIRFRGVLYAGLMLTSEGPAVLEYNVRFGDPETQAVLSRLRTGAFGLFERATVEGGLARAVLEWDPRPAVCAIAAAAGYPERYETGKPIRGLEDARAAAAPGELWIYHAGTARAPTGEILTRGGRVLGVTAIGADKEAARRRVYGALEKISFEGMHFRRDIGVPMG